MQIEVQPRKAHQLIHYIAVLLLDILLGHQYLLEIPLLSDPALITARKGRCPSVWMIHLLHIRPLPRSVWQEHQRSLGPEFWKVQHYNMIFWDTSSNWYLHFMLLLIIYMKLNRLITGLWNVKKLLFVSQLCILQQGLE